MNLDIPDNVIQFKPAAPGDPAMDVPRLTRKRGEVCGHYSMTCDEKARNAVCNRCGAVLDPFDALLQLARKWDSYAWELKRAREECVEAEAKLADVKRQLSNARVSLRRAK